METYLLRITLLSDTTFGRGDGLAGLVDQEVEHDAFGFPYLRGRTIKGLLSEECDAIVAHLRESTSWNAALRRLFGSAGSTHSEVSHWHIGDAQLPEDLRQAIATQQMSRSLTSTRVLDSLMVLDSLTAIRRQTAIDASTGTPEEGSLRAARVVQRNLVFTSRLQVNVVHDDDLKLLAAGVLALRRLGAGRNRGRGRVQCAVYELDAQEQAQDITREQFAAFERAIQ